MLKKIILGLMILVILILVLQVSCISNSSNNQPTLVESITITPKPITAQVLASSIDMSVTKISW